MQGVTVTLYANGTPISTTTNASGLYLFGNLTPTVPYFISFAPPPGYGFTPKGNNPASGTDSNADPATGQTAAVSLQSGQSDITLDAGLWRPAALGDYVWLDTNHNGLQDDGITGISGVQVTLLDANGNVVSTTTTFTGGPSNQPGYYTFTNLISNTYVVRFTNPAGYGVTLPNVNGNASDTTDSDGVLNGNFAVTNPIVLNAGQADATVDQGYWQPSSLGNYVWEDVNANGLQDEPASAGINGVTVRLLDSAGTLITTTVTANDASGNAGYYSFTNLVSGTYAVQFDLTTLPTGYKVTTQGASGSKDALDSDADLVTGNYFHPSVVPVCPVLSVYDRHSLACPKPYFPDVGL